MINLLTQSTSFFFDPIQQYLNFQEQAALLFTDDVKNQIASAFFFRQILSSERLNPLDAVLEKGVAKRMLDLFKVAV